MTRITFFDFLRGELAGQLLQQYQPVRSGIEQEAPLRQVVDLRLARDITHEVATRHRREAQTFAADHLSSAEPAFHGEHQNEQHEASGGDRERCALPPPWRHVRRTRCILSIGAADPGAARGGGK